MTRVEGAIQAMKVGSKKFKDLFIFQFNFLMTLLGRDITKRYPLKILLAAKSGTFYIFLVGTEAKIQLLLKNFPDSSVSSLIPTGWCRRASHHQKLALTFPGIVSCLMVTKQDFLEMEASL